MFFMGLLMAVPETDPLEEMGDEKLLLQTAEGNRTAFEKLYRNTYRKVYSYILSLMKNPTEADEILQETYMKIWTSAKSYQPQGKPLAWMFTIARNFCYMAFRARKRESDLNLEELSEGELVDHCTQLEDAADRDALNAALNILGEDERKIVLLHAASGMKHREIADAMELPLSTVLSKYNRAMKKLQKYLREEG